MLEAGRETALFNAFRATWAALQMAIQPVRYALLWIALESLFGPEDGREMTFRLSQRIAMFLAPDRGAARALFGAVKDAYGFRSKIVHGKWQRDSDAMERLADIERWTRTALLRLLQQAELRAIFSGRKTRETYLDALPY
jgi:hypothetical protein